MQDFINKQSRLISKQRQIL